MSEEVAVVDGGQPLQMTIELDGSGSCIAQARHLALSFLDRVRADHRLDISQRAVDLSQLVISELVTNAGKYAPGPALMDLRVESGMVEIVVWDSNPVLPEATAADADRIGQHGLEIVKAVTHSLESHRTPVGKRITARLPLTDDHDITSAAVRLAPSPIPVRGRECPRRRTGARDRCPLIRDVRVRPARQGEAVSA
ncbi:ATP-binding protein [Streptomyces sp. SUK 48]|uniref:ATP-binding protein n=1 Tax=Streptomyces sp. SUK 48 TaxID=2582831 RepID=UPI0031BB5FD7